MWNPEQYRRFAGERDRPFLDLLAPVDARAARTVADLGCGDGRLTASLLERCPEARITGVDGSAAMIEDARRLAVPGRLAFVLADLRHWTPEAPLDLLVSNAALQWVPDHPALIPRLAGLVGPGGTLALQVPGNFAAPSHLILAELRGRPEWRDRVGEGADRHLAVMEPAWYLDQLTGLGFAVNAWETTYLHLLRGEDPVLEWVRGTALRPVLARLEPAEAARFTAAYAARLREAYPARPYGTLLPFRRVFIVARRA